MTRSADSKTPAPAPVGTKAVRLNAGGLAKVAAIAVGHGVTTRTYLEALMHFAISCDERPGSWEAQGFSFESYDQRRLDAFADRWF